MRFVYLYIIRKYEQAVASLAQRSEKEELWRKVLNILHFAEFITQDTCMGSRV